MKQIFTLFTALVLMAAASQSSTVATPTGTSKPYVSPNPAHDYIKVNWQQNQCDNVIIQLFYPNGNLARTFTNRLYCEGIYSEMYKLAGLVRGYYLMRIQIGEQKWTYKVLIQ